MEHKKLAQRSLVKALKEVSHLALLDDKDLEGEPITWAEVGRFRAYALQMERVTEGVRRIVEELGIDLQMAEDVGALAAMVRESDAEEAREEALKRDRAEAAAEHAEHAPQGWRLAVGHFNLTQNWYSTPQVRKIKPMVEETDCTCTGRCT